MLCNTHDSKSSTEVEQLCTQAPGLLPRVALEAQVGIHEAGLPQKGPLPILHIASVETTACTRQVGAGERWQGHGGRASQQTAHYL